MAEKTEAERRADEARLVRLQGVSKTARGFLTGISNFDPAALEKSLRDTSLYLHEQGFAGESPVAGAAVREQVAGRDRMHRGGATRGTEE